MLLAGVKSDMCLFVCMFFFFWFFFFVFIIPNGYFSECIFIPKGFNYEFSDKKSFRIKTVRKNNLSEQKPFRIKTVRNKTFRRNDTSEYRPAPF